MFYARTSVCLLHYCMPASLLYAYLIFIIHHSLAASLLYLIFIIHHSSCITSLFNIHHTPLTTAGGMLFGVSGLLLLLFIHHSLTASLTCCITVCLLNIHHTPLTYCITHRTSLVLHTASYCITHHTPLILHTV